MKKKPMALAPLMLFIILAGCKISARDAPAEDSPLLEPRLVAIPSS